MIPEISPIGDKTNKPAMNLAISADFPAMNTYNLSMLEEENSRLKRLLIATTGFYVVAWIIGLTFGRFVNSDEYVIWYFEHFYAAWVSWIAIFSIYSWVPLAVFLFLQGLGLRKRYVREDFTGDRSIGNLSLLLPIVFLLIYLLTRLLY
jgi:hypothetical protein